MCDPDKMSSRDKVHHRGAFIVLHLGYVWLFSVVGMAAAVVTDISRFIPLCSQFDLPLRILFWPFFLALLLLESQSLANLDAEGYQCVCFFFWAWDSDGVG